MLSSRAASACSAPLSAVILFPVTSPVGKINAVPSEAVSVAYLQARMIPPSVLIGPRQAHTVAPATPSPIRSGVIQRPVAVNKPESNDAVRSVFSKVTVPSQLACEVEQFAPHAIRRIAIMVEMYLNLRETIPNQFAQSVNVLRTIFFCREKNGLSRRTTVRIPMPRGKGWILLQPVIHTPTFFLNSRFPPARLEMIRDAKHDMNCAERNPMDALTPPGPCSLHI